MRLLSITFILLLNAITLSTFGQDQEEDKKKEFTSKVEEIVAALSPEEKEIFEAMYESPEIAPEELFPGFISMKEAKKQGVIPSSELEIKIVDPDGNALEMMDMMTYTMSSDFHAHYYIHKETGQMGIHYQNNTPEQKVVMEKFLSQTMAEAKAERLEEQKNDPRLGTKLPQFSVQPLAGGKLSSKSLKKQVKVLNFWFVDCPPCRKEIPNLNALMKSYDSNSVSFIGFALDDKERLSEFLKDTPFDYNIIAESHSFAKENNVKAYPTNMVVDRDGTIIYVSTGYTDEIEAELHEAIEKALKN